MARYKGTRGSIAINGRDIDGTFSVDCSDANLPVDAEPIAVPEPVEMTVELTDVSGLDWFVWWLRLREVLLSHFSRN